MAPIKGRFVKNATHYGVFLDQASIAVVWKSRAGADFA
jgi:hypothetical protein